MCSFGGCGNVFVKYFNEKIVRAVGPKHISLAVCTEICAGEELVNVNAERVIVCRILCTVDNNRTGFNLRNDTLARTGFRCECRNQP